MKAEGLRVDGKLPKGWAIVTLKDLGNYINGRAFKPKEWKQEGLPIVRIQNLNNPHAKFNYSDVKHEEKYKLKNGDLLVAWSASLGVYIWNRGDAWLNQHIFRVEVNENIVTKQFLYYAIQEAIRELYLKAHGTGMVHVTKPVFESHPIALPPLNEQKRIVAKLEKLLAKVNESSDRLSRIPIILKRFRQSVLAAACSGRLTADWRDRHPDIEPAEELLKRIQEERIKRYEEECAKAKLEGRKKPKEYKKNPELIEQSNLPELPQTWEWERLVNIADVIGGVTKGRKLGERETVMLPYLRVANVQDGFLDLSEIKEIKVLPEDLGKYKLEFGDILFNEGGDRDKLGRGTVWRNEIENCIHQNHVYRARLYNQSILPEYVSMVTKTIYARSFFFNNASQTVNLASINLTSLGSVPLAIPPLEEQKEIVRRVEALFRKCDLIEQRYLKAKAYTDKLTQSILAKAFRGELVPQDPNDEPAEVLLERIKIEKALTEKSNKSKKIKRIN